MKATGGDSTLPNVAASQLSQFNRSESLLAAIAMIVSSACPSVRASLLSASASAGRLLGLPVCHASTGEQ
jgi:hypothetical protein